MGSFSVCIFLTLGSILIMCVFIRKSPIYSNFPVMWFLIPPLFFVQKCYN